MFVLDIDHHSIATYDSFDVFLLSSHNVMGRTREFSQNLGLFYSCFETIFLLLRSYIKLFNSFTIARHEFLGS